MSVKIVSWNIAKKHEPWRELVRMEADVALLQEAVPPPVEVARLRDATLPPVKGAGPLDIGPREAWDSHSWNSEWWHGRGWRALFDRWPMVVRLSDCVDVEWFRQIRTATLGLASSSRSRNPSSVLTGNTLLEGALSCGGAPA